jgi:hypothetical protein
VTARRACPGRVPARGGHRWRDIRREQRHAPTPPASSTPLSPAPSAAAASPSSLLIPSPRRIHGPASGTLARRVIMLRATSPRDSLPLPAGWAYHGRIADAALAVGFARSALVRSISLLSGVARTDHHVTDLRFLFAASAASPEWRPLPVALAGGGGDDAGLLSLVDGEPGRVRVATPAAEEVQVCFSALAVVKWPAVAKWLQTRSAVSLCCPRLSSANARTLSAGVVRVGRGRGGDGRGARDRRGQQ